MGKRGPVSRSRKSKAVRGSPGKRPVEPVRQGPAPGRPKCPAFLGKVARAKWRQVVPHLEALGVLTAVDGDVLTAYCLAWEELQAATELLRTEGRTSLKGSGGLGAHPAVAMQRTAWKAVKDFAAVLGLSPGCRRGWLDGREAEAQDDPITRFLSGQEAVKSS